MKQINLRNVVLCSYRFMAHSQKMVPQLANKWKNLGYQFVASPECADWSVIVFDDKGVMTTITIEEWYPDKPSLWKRMLRKVWKRI